MSKSDEARPEPVLFLLAAADALKAYRAKHGHYPREWHHLDLTFANGPYRDTDPGIRPTKEQGNRWRPKDSQYTYALQTPDPATYLIQAVNKDNKVEYEMRPGMDAPKKVLITPEDELCTQEQPRGKIIPEPARFLNATAARFAEFRKKHGEYPRSWEQLDFHWAMVPHKPNEARVRPPAGSGRTWQPLGSDYAYEITRSDKSGYEMRSRNGKGLDDYKLSSTDVSPVPVK
jgi:hypothetical protein